MVLAKPKFLLTQLFFHDACKYMLWPNVCISLKCREEKKLLLERDQRGEQGALGGLHVRKPSESKPWERRWVALCLFKQKDGSWLLLLPTDINRKIPIKFNSSCVRQKQVLKVLLKCIRRQRGLLFKKQKTQSLSPPSSPQTEENIANTITQ